GRQGPEQGDGRRHEVASSGARRSAQEQQGVSRAQRDPSAQGRASDGADRPRQGRRCEDGLREAGVRNPVSRGAWAGILLVAWLPLPAMGALATSASETLSGSRAPDIQAETFDGQIFSRPAAAGKVACVNFFASWCPICQAENQELRQVQQEFAGRG